MKPCPYCAESIQDAAVKCRFCGEWLDPRQQPPWSPPESDVPPSANPAASPGFTPPPTQPASPDEPLRKQTQVWAVEPPPSQAAPSEPKPSQEPSGWAAPPWLAEPRQSHEAASPPPPSEAPSTPSTPSASLEDVARRMQRIKASAEVVRSALGGRNQAQADAPAAPIDPGPPVSPQPASPPAAQPAAQAPADDPHVSPQASALASEFFGSDDLDESSDQNPGFSGLESMVAARRPLPWKPIVLGAVTVFAISLGVLAMVMDFGASEAETVDAEPAEGVREGGIAPAVAQPPAPPSANSTAAVAADAAAEGTSADETATATAAEDRKRLDESAKAKLAQAREAYRNRELDKAEQLLGELLEQFPKAPQALLLHAQVLLERNKKDDSLATATKCVEVDEETADCWLTLGVLRQERGQKRGAIEAYEKYLSLAPEGQYARDVQTQLGRLK